jgi:beta-N-acetylhexosaminidase
LLASIFGLEGTRINDWEKAFFRESNPVGFILFARNVESPDQLRALTLELRDCVGRQDAPILIDQEGGRVQRMGPPSWRKAPPAECFSELHARDPKAGVAACRANAALMGLDLIEAGITVDCAPVLDLRVEGAHDIIGDRSYGSDPDRVTALGRSVCEGLLSAGVLPVIKHLPGHGRAGEDSHEALPRVSASLDELEASDFKPFRALKDATWGMTAHIVYDALDPQRPATQSPEALRFLREEIGFDGVLVSDDLSMKALGGAFETRSALALEAGCDLVLHCNGDRAEMAKVAKGSASLTQAAKQRLERGEATRRDAKEVLDRAALSDELNRLLASAPAAV